MFCSWCLNIIYLLTGNLFKAAPIYWVVNVIRVIQKKYGCILHFYCFCFLHSSYFQGSVYTSPQRVGTTALVIDWMGTASELFCRNRWNTMHLCICYNNAALRGNWGARSARHTLSKKAKAFISVGVGEHHTSYRRRKPPTPSNPSVPVFSLLLCSIIESGACLERKPNVLCSYKSQAPARTCTCFLHAHKQVSLLPRFLVPPQRGPLPPDYAIGGSTHLSQWS